MGRNVNSFFSEAPATVDMKRSRFERPYNVKTSFNAGSLIPFYCSDILPGDTISIDTSKVVRMSTLITPVMDDIYLDVYWFFVPLRLCWDHTKQFFGENTSSAWIPSSTYTIPQITAPTGGWNVGTIADYIGVPTGVGNISIDRTPFTAYAMVCDQWFRDENNTDPLYIYTGDSTVAGSNGSSYRTDVALGGAPFKVAKFHDEYSSALPSPQKGQDVPLPLGQTAVVYPSNTSVPSALMPNVTAMRMSKSDGTSLTGNFDLRMDNSVVGAYNQGDNSGWQGNVFPNNLVVDLTTATGTSINQLREAFQVQKFYETQARSGSRYTETIKGFFGVTSPDARLQRPEYLGGSRVPINVHQVVQSSSTDSTSPQGNTTAYSLTIDTHSEFTKSFTEHGWLLGLMCARYKHSYSQGIPRMFSRHDFEDFYWPVFANLGEVGILNKEIYAQGSTVIDSATGKPYDEEVFGYQERWFEYRYKPNMVTGMMRPTYSASLDMWHLGDHYTSLPALSDAWIREDETNIDRTLAVASTVSHQFIADIFVKETAVRVMPLYSIPGLIDHH